MFDVITQFRCNLFSNECTVQSSGISRTILCHAKVLTISLTLFFTPKMICGWCCDELSIMALERMFRIAMRLIARAISADATTELFDCVVGNIFVL
jgi:hypothetical protein